MPKERKKKISERHARRLRQKELSKIMSDEAGSSVNLVNSEIDNIVLNKSDVSVTEKDNSQDAVQASACSETVSSLGGEDLKLWMKDLDKLLRLFDDEYGDFIDSSDPEDEDYIGAVNGKVTDNYLCSDDEETENSANDASRCQKVAEFVLSHDIPRTTVNDLLKLLRNEFNGIDLPKTYETLLKTPAATVITPMPPGEYLHLGIKENLQKVIQFVNNENIELTVNVDGLPIAKSTTKALWPILGSIKGTNQVFIIGIYCGDAKPNDSNQLLKQFTEEAKVLTENGLDMNGKHYNFVLRALVLDAPAKSFVLKIKGHTGFSSCTKCFAEGHHENGRTCFPTKERARTDEDFLKQNDDEFHQGTTVLSEIPNLGLISATVLDPMHLLYLGCMRKLLLLWTCGSNLEYKLSHNQVNEISEALLNVVKPATPVEFARKARSLKYLKI